MTSLTGGGHCLREVPFAKPLISDEELRAVSRVLTSGWLTHGPKTKQFEKEFSEYCHAKHAIATSSGTAALHVSLAALGIKKGAEVIVPALTHVATAHVVLYQGARPVFADVDPETYNIDPIEIEKRVTKKTKAIIPVHFAGQPCKMDEIIKIAKEHNLHIVEDAAHAVGAEYKGKKIGALSTTSTCFSFYPTKNITTGEGGMITTENDALARVMEMMKAFGITKSPLERILSEKPWAYEVVMLGYNYRMTDIESVIGICQLKRLDKANDKRIENAKYLTEGLESVNGIQTPIVEKNVKHVFHVYQIKVSKNARLSRNELILKLKEKRIGTSVYYPLPVPLMPFYRKLHGYREGDYPTSEAASKTTIALPCHPLLSNEDLDYIISSIKELLSSN